MNLNFGSSSKRTRNAQVQIFRTRLVARLCIALCCFSQFIARISTIDGIIKDKSSFRGVAIAALPFAPMISLIIAIEYLLFKKKGPAVVRYSNFVDIILLLFFMADWIIGVITALVKTVQLHPALFTVSSLYGFVSFIWRALLVTLIVQKWQLKIIAPVVVLMVATGYTIYYDPKHLWQILIRFATQLFNPLIVRKEFVLRIFVFYASGTNTVKPLKKLLKSKNQPSLENFQKNS